MSWNIAYRRYWLLGGLLLLLAGVCAQQSDSTRNWDNHAYLGNKVTAGGERWKYSAELQIRLKDNMQSLDRWFLEAVATYLASEKFEIVPDVRLTIKPDKVEIRPGFGVFYKQPIGDFLFVHQLKWQIDINTSTGQAANAMRYAVFVNRSIGQKFIANFTAGFVYRWKEEFNGVQFTRFGPGLTYIVNMQHSMNFNYFLSADNDGKNWSWAGIPVIQLIININKGYKYVPAEYFSF